VPNAKAHPRRSRANRAAFGKRPQGSFFKHARNRRCFSRVEHAVERGFGRQQIRDLGRRFDEGLRLRAHGFGPTPEVGAVGFE